MAPPVSWRVAACHFCVTSHALPHGRGALTVRPLGRHNGTEGERGSCGGREIMAQMEDERRNPGNYLLYWRNRRNLSLNILSARIAAGGRQFASAKTLNRWERGETPLPDWAITELSRVLKVTEEELLHGPREADPRLPTNVSAAYTGLDMEIAARVIGMGFTNW